MTADGSDEPTDVDLVTHPYRRHLLATLYLSSPPLPLADVADWITVRETGDDPEDHPEFRLRIYMALYHDHLPELEDADVVAYDQAADEVDLGPLGPRLETLVMGDLRDEDGGLPDAGSGTSDDD